MTEESRVDQRFADLLTEADEVRSTARKTKGGTLVDGLSLARWTTSCAAAVLAAFGETGVYYTDFCRARDGTHYDSYNRFLSLRAVLEAAARDFRAGYGRDLHELVAGEVFSDFLDMAEHLAGQGYHHAAASLAGAVLEDALRRLHSCAQCCAAKGRCVPAGQVSRGAGVG